MRIKKKWKIQEKNEESWRKEKGEYRMKIEKKKIESMKERGKDEEEMEKDS